MADDVLALCRSLPTLDLAAGQLLLEQGVPTDRLYVLAHGAVEVVRGGVRVVRIDEPGAFLGEISVLLGTVPTASVSTLVPSRFHVIDQAGAGLRGSPELTHAVAQLLARRLQAVTAYLVDLKRQYAATDTHLALMDQVLANLMTTQGTVPEVGSEREDVPED
jgi:CRP/FNR family cyclic AMP-dependent transcriptional regulator